MEQHDRWEMCRPARKPITAIPSCDADSSSPAFAHQRTTTSPLVYFCSSLMLNFSTKTQSGAGEFVGFRHGCIDAPSTLQACASGEWLPP